MSSSAYSVKIEGLGKRYLVPHLAKQAGGWQRLFAHLKEYLPFMDTSEQDYFWALKDVTFEVKPGEILGIIGKNGSGKSTLLKILSGITPPTAGRALISGKVGSLLEVGTGFHPDLTGRENVFMSGVLLGLSRTEVRDKFDEIVDFSGIEPFIDVPVKRYSSGMYVRLAYSVASMLRSDILILDEVMAVGDTEFREKSQHNIENIAAQGRTILFVSHNTRAVQTLCRRGIVLDRGACTFQGSAEDAVHLYMRQVHHYDAGAFREDTTKWDLARKPRLEGHQNQVVSWISTHRPDGTPASSFRTGEGLLVRIGLHGAKAHNPYVSVLIQNELAERVATLHSTHTRPRLELDGSAVVTCAINELRLGEGIYRIMVDYGDYSGGRIIHSLDCVPNAAIVRVSVGDYVSGVGMDAYQGAVHRSEWSVQPYMDL
jgi:lipopolysaccharide transport system ATP-binding protein